LVKITKWVIIAAGLVFLGLFTQEAAATGLTGTLQRTGLSGVAIGSGATAAGTGIGAGISGLFKGVLSPFWEIRNIVRGFMNLGSATPWLEETHSVPTQGGGTNETTGDGGGSDPIPTDPIIPGPKDVYTPTKSTYPSSYNTQTDFTITPTLPPELSLPSIYGGQYVPISQGGGTTENSGGGGGTWGSNVSTPSGGVASGNLSLSSWGGE